MWYLVTWRREHKMKSSEFSKFEQLDDQLNTPSQLQVSQFVKAMPEDTLSMAWRSSLNEKLIEASNQKRRKQKLAWILRPAMGLGLAFALAIFVVFQPMGSHTVMPDRGLEAAILTDHHNAVLQNEVSTAGLNANEVISEANPEEPEDGIWNDADVQGL